MFYLFYNDNFVVLMYDLYFRVCLRFGINGFNLSLEEIESDYNLNVLELKKVMDNLMGTD